VSRSVAGGGLCAESVGAGSSCVERNGRTAVSIYGRVWWLARAGSRSSHCTWDWSLLQSTQVGNPALGRAGPGPVLCTIALVAAGPRVIPFHCPDHPRRSCLQRSAHAAASAPLWAGAFRVMVSMMQPVVPRCTMLQPVVPRCTMLQPVVLRCTMLQPVVLRCTMLQPVCPKVHYVATCCPMVFYVTTCCPMVHHVATGFRLLQAGGTCHDTLEKWRARGYDIDGTVDRSGLLAVSKCA
jgi:hypothetical protein